MYDMKWYKRARVMQILSKMELSLLHQIRYEYNKTGRMLNRTEIDPQTILSQHVTVVMDAIQLKVYDSTWISFFRVIVLLKWLGLHYKIRLP